MPTTYEITPKGKKMLDELTKGTQIHKVLSTIAKGETTNEKLAEVISTGSKNPETISAWYVGKLMRDGAVKSNRAAKEEKPVAKKKKKPAKKAKPVTVGIPAKAMAAQA